MSPHFHVLKQAETQDCRVSDWGEHVTSSFENLVTWYKSASYFATGHTGRKYNIEHDL